MVRGGVIPTLERGGVEHTCPSAEHVARPPGRKPAPSSGAAVRLVLVVPAELKERVTAAAGGTGRVNAWGIRVLEAATGGPAPPAKRRRKAS